MYVWFTTVEIFPYSSCHTKRGARYVSASETRGPQLLSTPRQTHLVWRAPGPTLYPVEEQAPDAVSPVAASLVVEVTALMMSGRKSEMEQEKMGTAGARHGECMSLLFLEYTRAYDLSGKFMVVVVMLVVKDCIGMKACGLARGVGWWFERCAGKMLQLCTKLLAPTVKKQSSERASAEIRSNVSADTNASNLSADWLTS